ncbi:MAG: DUF11 domain-containing protein [Clostridia bacterium]|nr:DUF11 domain-containing protein [Clostridia bacterium]
MKKLISLILALIMLVSVFSACGEKPAETGGADDTAQTDTAQTEDNNTQPAPAADPDEEPHYRHFDNPYQEALVIYAETMLARKTLVQYDDTRLVEKSNPVVYRWRNKTMAAEDYTKQLTGYTNCACFTYDCYYFALGYDIETWHTNALYYKYPERLVFSHENTKTETDEEKAKLKEEFLNTLEPGDIVVCHHAGDVYGHAMLYVGDGKIIHSAAPGGGNYNYSGKKDLVEPAGSIAYMEVTDLFGTASGWHLWGEARFGIVRPLLGYDKPIPEATKNRVKNLQNVYVQKTATQSVGQTVNPGGEITYTIEIRNGNKWAMPLEVIDYVPEYTAYVSGGDTATGDEVKWSVSVPKGETLKLEYTVKVNDDPSLIGKCVFTDKGSVGGVPVKCPAIYIEKTLTKEEQSKMTAAIEANAGSSLRGIELANKIYGDALGKTVGFESKRALLFGVYKQNGGNYALDKSGKYYGISVPTMYGGYHVDLTDDYGKERTRGPQTAHLIAGDIIVMSEDADGERTYAYMYTGSNTLMSLEDGSVLDLVNSKDVLLSTLGYHMFVIARPSMAF